LQDQLRIELFGHAGIGVDLFLQPFLQFPSELHRVVNKGEIIWKDLDFACAIRMLKNPKYAGAYVYGKTRTYNLPNGQKKTERLPEDQWRVLIKNAHEGYITWEEYKKNKKRLRENAQANGQERRKGPPREGPALLQGIIICGYCGERMSSLYHFRKGQKIPRYVCQREFTHNGKEICQSVSGLIIDEKISELLLKSITPMAVEVALNVQKEIEEKAEEINNTSMSKELNTKLILQNGAICRLIRKTVWWRVPWRQILMKN